MESLVQRALPSTAKVKGPYAGAADGGIFKYQSSTSAWIEFVVTARHKIKGLCDGSTSPYLEPICGRPLSLQFNHRTCELYITDAYFGLIKVGRNERVATQLTTSVERTPFRFNNALDIDQETGVVYFTDTSTRFQRRQNLLLTASGDHTGRLIRYDPVSRRVTILVKDLCFANGVALSKDHDYVLVAETSRQLIRKYWFHGLRPTNPEVLIAQLLGSPVNINRNVKGEFWVASNDGRTTPPLSDETITAWISGYALCWLFPCLDYWMNQYTILGY